ncbi:MAG: hypothetical protein HC827_15050 [Cyanobacteria bacterium RM1_2_2]|nr:hypothetical protein [Cyanobacteria bacterium RM1_2_2]
MKRVHKHWLQGIGLEFWLPLPLLALLFWLGCDLIMAQVLSRPQSAGDKLQANTDLEVHLSANISMIRAVIDREEGMTRVDMQTTESVLKKFELEFQLVDANQIEAAIAQELRISRQDVRRLARYEIVN